MKALLALLRPIGVVFVLVAGCGLTAAAEGPLYIPQGQAATIDGTIHEQEWADALSVELPRSVTLHLKHRDGWLYIGIRADQLGMFVGNVCVIRDHELYILHSSAALGTAVYQWTGSAWTLARDFVWRCRALGFSPAAIQDRQSFLEQEGWLASISYLGVPEEMEYQVSVSDSSLLTWIVLLPGSGALLLNWPEIVDQDLFPGPIPGETLLGLGAWARLILEP
ncbi:hypothetical protein JW848_03110 [Candidatus Bipolaricaulota bacterium]|nr:hypothetical protein [Candidatus Bipolaricaulota bacterium]